ncbi:hypothetical protein KOR42_41810 [Thalassoglobus neptunius]|uniref:Uncharacterized protein n=1 Tax=Thalassoglobus neptunius TaxID=1938619 RepID=A0A5C5WAH8_9PLAN|nr:hypothetical protein [Thalassoglobus neptunius]TWT47069.1 hypothetical protein KOR42_41810 [Thalassoglobus neptunius]
MSPDDRRSHLENAGFAIAMKPFRSQHGLRWYGLQLLPDGTRGGTKLAELAGRQFSIDLETGRWNFWGTVGEQEFHEGPWWDGPPAETPEPAPTEQHVTPTQKRLLVHDRTHEVVGETTPEHETFLDRCRDFGLEWSGPLNQFGNVFATRAKRRYLIHTWSKKLTDCSARPQRIVTLDQLVSETLNNEITEPPVPRQQTMTIDRRPVVVQGANRQTSLF